MMQFIFEDYLVDEIEQNYVEFVSNNLFSFHLTMINYAASLIDTLLLIVPKPLYSSLIRKMLHFKV